MSLDFVFGLPKASAGNTGVVVFVDRLSKTVHLAAVPDTIDAAGTATLYIDRVFRQHGLPESIVSDRDRRFTGKFWTSVFAVLGTRLDLSTAYHPQTDGQTKRANSVVEDIIRSICAETPKRWSIMLPLVEFALNNAVHASTGFTPFYVNGLTHPRVPLTPSRRDSGLGGGGLAARLAEVSPRAVRNELDDFLSVRLNVLRHVRDAMAESQDVQKEQADARGRGNVENFEVGDLVLLNAKTLPTHAVFKTKLRPRFIGPFKVVAKKGLAYALNLPKKIRTHPVFYVGLLKPYRDPSLVSAEALAPMRANAAPMAAEGQHPAAPSPTAHAGHGESRRGSGALSRSGHDSKSSESLDLRDRGARAQRLPSHPHSGQTYPPPNGGTHHSHEPALGARPVGGARRAGPAAARRPPALLDEHGELHYHVEGLLKRRQHRGHTQYLVQWRGEPPSWEYEVPLRQDCPQAVDAFDRGHPRRSTSSQPKCRSTRASRR
ncbi:hypothetical protein PF007_g10697 [Phytophthora fragariae]|uniref:Integrase catalytic domain-containing protein n=1 Tax=Phytophthora fragariae TaxID=53985 RepID=A0A6A3SCS7_9STRA|nr:hypothetical protein PF003_g15328 [Phytophthora fragariae]KAE9113568.1 hypothetical protein PF007_g10697 [Phytophthora fragariae]